jgi:hypothetical protein
VCRSSTFDDFGFDILSEDENQVERSIDWFAFERSAMLIEAPQTIDWIEEQLALRLDAKNMMKRVKRLASER